MMKVARNNGLPEDQISVLKDAVSKYSDSFRVSISLAPPADVSPLKIGLIENPKPVCVLLQNNFQDQTKFLSIMASTMVKNAIAYPNPCCPWACAPLVARNTRPDCF